MAEKTNSSSGSAQGPTGKPPRSKYLGMAVGQQVKLTKRLGNDRLGEMFAAVHPVLARRFAVKVVRPALTREDRPRDRLRQVAREVSVLEHPAVVPVLDFGQLGKSTFYLMLEFVRGTALNRALVSHQPLELGRALGLLVQLADVLVAAHRERVVHGDVKPGNILLVRRPDGREVLRLSDFRLSQALALEPTAEDPLAHLRIYSTLEFLPPEVIAGEAADARADMYAFGALAYRMVCGEPVFKGKPLEVLEGHRSMEPVPPSRRLQDRDTLPAKVDRIITRCLCKDPARRPGSMTTIGQELRSLIQLTGAARLSRVTLTEGVPAVGSVDPEEREAPLPESPARVRDLLYASIHELARLAMAQRVASDEMKLELATLEEVEAGMRQVQTEYEEIDERVEEVRRGLREREASLRYAIIDLSLTRDSLADRPEAASQVRDLEFQVTALEQSLARLEKHRGEVMETLTKELLRHQEAVDSEERRIGSCHRRLHGQIEAVRHRLSGEDAVALYRTITRCQRALKIPAA